MALHLTLEKGDRVLLSGGIVVDVRRTGKFVQLSFEAPEGIKIERVFLDPKKQSEYGSSSDE
jgi:preprotein translocase subunit YajC